MNNVEPGISSIKDALEQVHPHAIRSFSRLTPAEIDFITQPGHITHAVNQEILLAQISTGKLQPVGDAYTKAKYLRVHVTALNGETLFVSTKYPGMRSKSLNTGVVLTENAVRKSTLPGKQTNC